MLWWWWWVVVVKTKNMEYLRSISLVSLTFLTLI